MDTERERVGKSVTALASDHLLDLSYLVHCAQDLVAVRESRETPARSGSGLGCIWAGRTAGAC
jgi:hypothetical protein